MFFLIAPFELSGFFIYFIALSIKPAGSKQYNFRLYLGCIQLLCILNRLGLSIDMSQSTRNSVKDILSSTSIKNIAKSILLSLGLCQLKRKFKSSGKIFCLSSKLSEKPWLLEFMAYPWNTWELFNPCTNTRDMPTVKLWAEMERRQGRRIWIELN